MSAEQLQLQASRTEQRKQRLLEVERELAAEEAEALKMTEVRYPKLFLVPCFHWLQRAGATAVALAAIQGGQS